MEQKKSEPQFVSPRSLENDFSISLQHNELPIAFSPCRVDRCLVCVCLEGSAELEVNLQSFKMVRNHILVVFPGQILACNQKTDDFKLAFFSIANQLIDEILYRLPSAFIGFLKEHSTYLLPELEKNGIMQEVFSSLYQKFCDTTHICRSEIISNLLHNFYMDLYNKVLVNNSLQTRQRNRKKELQEEFFRLVNTYTANREVAFYAEKLCITPKYLSIITNENVGTSAKELIDKFAITELKLQLKSTSIPLKEIAAKLNYPCEAFLCKYFKKHTGITPSHYRNAAK